MERSAHIAELAVQPADRGGRRRKDVMRLRALMFTIAPAIALVSATSGPAWPAEDGATVVREEFCQPNPVFNSTVCFDLKYVLNETVTPSGNISFVANGENHIQQTGGTCDFTAHTEFHGHYLLKDGVLQERSNRQDNSFTAECPGFTRTCTVFLHSHYAQGKFQYNRAEIDCPGNPT